MEVAGAELHSDFTNWVDRSLNAFSANSSLLEVEIAETPAVLDMESAADIGGYQALHPHLRTLAAKCTDVTASAFGASGISPVSTFPARLKASVMLLTGSAQK